MKRLLFLLCLAACLPARAQSNFKLSATTSYASFSPKTYQNNGTPYVLPARTVRGFGLAAELYVSEFVSFYYSFEYGNTSQGATYMRYPFGIAFAGELLANRSTATGNNSDIGYALVIALLLPEGVHFHIPLMEEKLYISPYISPLTLYREKLPNQDAKRELGLSLGSKVEFFAQNFSIAPYIGARTLYSNRTGGFGLEGGLHIGFLLSDW